MFANAFVCVQSLRPSHTGAGPEGWHGFHLEVDWSPLVLSESEAEIGNFLILEHLFELTIKIFYKELQNLPQINAKCP